MLIGAAIAVHACGRLSLDPPLVLALPVPQPLGQQKCQLQRLSGI
jgi:hypothetical protein